LINLIIGEGTAQYGNFAEIDWSGADYFLEVSIDTENNGSYIVTGVSQFLSVPYAYHTDQANEAMRSRALTLTDEKGNEYELGVDTLGNIVTHQLNPKRIIIRFSAAPTNIEIVNCPVRYDKKTCTYL